MADQYFVIIKGKERTDDNWTAPLPGNGWEHAQTGPCPDCGGTWVWAENGCVPGTRKCTTCKSVFSVHSGSSWYIQRERLYRR